MVFHCVALPGKELEVASALQGKEGKDQGNSLELCRVAGEKVMSLVDIDMERGEGLGKEFQLALRPIARERGEGPGKEFRLASRCVALPGKEGKDQEKSFDSRCVASPGKEGEDQEKNKQRMASRVNQT